MSRLFALSLFAAASTASLARADVPSDATISAASAPAKASTHYLGVDALAGGWGGSFGIGLAIDGGTKLPLPGLWLHGRVVATTGTPILVDGPATTHLVHGRAGLEGRACLWSGVACGFVDGDVGVEYIDAKVMDRPLESAVGVVVAARAGLDLGGKNLRVRPSIETSRSRYSAEYGFDSVAVFLGLGVAFQW